MLPWLGATKADRWTPPIRNPFVLSRLYCTKDGRRHPLRSGDLRRALVAADDSLPGRIYRSPRAVAAARRAATRGVHLDSRAKVKRPGPDPAFYTHLPRPVALEVTGSGARHGVDTTSGLSRDPHRGGKEPQRCAPALSLNMGSRYSPLTRDNAQTLRQRTNTGPATPASFLSAKSTSWSDNSCSSSTLICRSRNPSCSSTLHRS